MNTNNIENNSTANRQKQNLVIRKVPVSDFRTVENLTREAFWNVYRPGCTEHFVLHKFRDRADFIPELELEMLLDGVIIGHVMYARAVIDADDGRKIPIMTFGPISISPEYKRHGFGTILLRRSMELAKQYGANALAITGNLDFYGKSGFVVASTRGVHYFAEPRTEEAPYFLIKELTEGFLDGITGTYRDPDGYFVDDAEAEAFDAEFPPKEKLKLPGQLF